MFKKLAAVAALSTVLATGAQATTVSLELMLLTDNSGTISTSDFNLIKEGYARAFEDATVQDKILNSSTGSIAVATSFFGTNYGGISGAWTLIDSAASADAYAAFLRAMSRPNTGTTTNIRAGLLGAAAEFATNTYDSIRQVIDLTGDGAQNVSGGCTLAEAVCVALQNDRDTVLSGEVDTINALFVNDANRFGNLGTEAVNSILYGQTNVIGGDNAFVVAANDFNAFQGAIRDKIIREIAPPPVPLPAGGVLLLTGFGAMAVMRRRKARKAA